MNRLIVAFGVLVSLALLLELLAIGGCSSSFGPLNNLAFYNVNYDPKGLTCVGFYYTDQPISPFPHYVTTALYFGRFAYTLNILSLVICIGVFSYSHRRHRRTSITKPVSRCSFKFRLRSYIFAKGALFLLLTYYPPQTYERYTRKSDHDVTFGWGLVLLWIGYALEDAAMFVWWWMWRKERGPYGWSILGDEIQEPYLDQPGKIEYGTDAIRAEDRDSGYGSASELESGGECYRRSMSV